MAVASDEPIEAYILYTSTEILALWRMVDDEGIRLQQLLSRVQAGGSLRFPKVHPAEVPREILETVGFRPTGAHLVYSARARSDHA